LLFIYCLLVALLYYLFTVVFYGYRFVAKLSSPYSASLLPYSYLLFFYCFAITLLLIFLLFYIACSSPCFIYYYFILFIILLLLLIALLLLELFFKLFPNLFSGEIGVENILPGS
jgi:hypothetical protein